MTSQYHSLKIPPESICKQDKILTTSVRVRQGTALNSHSSSRMVDVVVYTQLLEQSLRICICLHLCQEWEEWGKVWYLFAYTSRDERECLLDPILLMSVCASLCSDTAQQLQNFKGRSAIHFLVIVIFFTSYLYSIWSREVSQ